MLQFINTQFFNISSLKESQQREKAIAMRALPCLITIICNLTESLDDRLQQVKEYIVKFKSIASYESSFSDQLISKSASLFNLPEQLLDQN